MQGFLGGAKAAPEFERLPDGRVKLYDEQFTLKDPQGQSMADAAHKLTASDGSEFAASDAEGRSLRASTAVAESLKFELRWHGLQS